MLHNADEYPNPELFDPDRFMKMPGREPARDPRMAVFGFGKRSVFTHCHINLS